MTKRINEVKLHFPENREDLIREATAEDETCVSVGGLAESLGMTTDVPASVAPPALGPMAFAKLVEFWRREQQLTVSALAGRAGLSEVEILDAERGEAVPEPRVLHALSSVLKVSYQKLLLLTGHVVDRDKALSKAAIRFAARSEPMDRLNSEEEDALHDFIRALAE